MNSLREAAKLVVLYGGEEKNSIYLVTDAVVKLERGNSAFPDSS